MKRREELAHDFFCALLHSGCWAREGPEADVATVFALADAFLAACGEKPAQEREPEVWILEGSIAWNESEEAWATHCRRLLAGRDRVKLAVRVMEDGE